MSTNPVTDTVIRLTIKQGIESERLSDELKDDIKFQNRASYSKADFESYEFFPSGELIYTRDTGRVFVGNNTYPKSSDNENVTLTNQITPGGTLVGNKYLGRTSLTDGTFDGSSLAFDEHHHKISEYDSDYKAYTGDYIFDKTNYSLILFDKNINIDKDSFLSNIKEDSNAYTIANNIIGERCASFISVIPEGEFLDYEVPVKGYPQIITLKALDLKLLKVHFDCSEDYSANSEKSFYISGDKIHSYVHDKIEQSSLANVYKSNKFTKNRVVINDDNGLFAVHSSVSDTELAKLNGLETYKDASNTELTLQDIIGHPYWAGTQSPTNKNGEKVWNRKSTNVYSTDYNSIWDNIGSTEWSDGTHRGTIWSNIGNSLNFVGSTNFSAQNSTNNQANSKGLSFYDHNINSSGKASGNAIDIWYNIGNPLEYANIWKYENGKRTNTKQISGNVVPYSSTSSGYRYQSLWDCIGARKPSATTAQHYNIWNHIGDNTSYTTKFSDLSWPTASTAKPIPTVISKDYSLSSLKTTLWSAINYLRSNINELYNEIRQACNKLTSYIDTESNELLAKIEKIKENVVCMPNYYSPITYMKNYSIVKGNATTSYGYIAHEDGEYIILKIPHNGWLYCAGNGLDGSSEVGLLIERLSGNKYHTVMDPVAYDYGHPFILFPVEKDDTFKISCPNNVRLNTVTLFKSKELNF